MMIKRGICAVVMVLLVASCTTRAKYEAMVKEELESGERYDSLYLGLSLGMTDSAFYAKCFQLNKEEKVYQGSRNLSVTYRFSDLGEEAWMDFYPKFVDGKIVEMPTVFRYDGWAPWNRELYSDSLQTKVLDLFGSWYGPEFLEVKHPEHGSAFVRVDGNRQITVFRLDDQNVKVIFKDLLAEDDEELL